ncbi:MAG: ABC transporter substrate-binding protein [bacterium]|nr:ABC transporter substrate-binding protein [bacterium]
MSFSKVGASALRISTMEAGTIAVVGAPPVAARRGRPRSVAPTLVLALTLCAACHSPEAVDEPGRDPGPCVDRFAPEVDYFPAKIEPRYAERFRVEYFRHYKVVTISTPWSGAESRLRYLLVQCGTPRPPGYEDAEVIEIPVRTLVTTSTTELPHVVELDLVDRLVGHDELDYVGSPAIRRRIAAGEIVEVGSSARINIELVVAADPGLVLASGLGTPEIESFAKLRELGVRVVQIPSFLETSPLGRAEWIKYTALFFNREARAEEVFDGVAERYLELAARARAAGERPTVLTGGPIGEVWHVPGGRSFMAALLADAGARYLWADDPSTGAVPLAMESVYERALEAELWLHPGGWGSLAEITAVDERFTRLAAFENQRVFNNDARMNTAGDQALAGNDYWETGAARPDLVLADLIKIFHPELVPEHELVFHRRLE